MKTKLKSGTEKPIAVLVTNLLLVVKRLGGRAPCPLPLSTPMPTAHRLNTTDLVPTSLKVTTVEAYFR